MHWIDRYWTELWLAIGFAILMLTAAGYRRVVALQAAVPFLACMVFYLLSFSIIGGCLISLKHKRRLSEFWMGVAIAIIIVLPAILCC